MLGGVYQSQPNSLELGSDYPSLYAITDMSSVWEAFLLLPHFVGNITGIIRVPLRPQIWKG